MLGSCFHVRKEKTEKWGLRLCWYGKFSYLCSKVSQKGMRKLMEQDLLFEICGVVASVGMILGYLPQAVETIRKKVTAFAGQV